MSKIFTEEHRRHISESKKGSKYSQLHRQHIGDAMKKPVIAYDKFGTSHEFNSLKECGEVLGISCPHICNYLAGRRSSCKGYTIIFKEGI